MIIEIAVFATAKFKLTYNPRIDIIGVDRAF